MRSSALKWGSISFLVCLILCINNQMAVCADSSGYLAAGNRFYKQYVQTQNKAFLDKAYLNYYKASEIEPSASSYLGMGMVLLEKKYYSKSKECLYKAYGIDENDATVNYYLAKYSYEDRAYLKALDFYKKAYDKGLSGLFDVNFKLAEIYAKLGDFSRAKKFYNAAMALNPNEANSIQASITAIELLESSKSKYGASSN